ncbi:serine kinase protein [Rutstroemia sp. NJR-2017a BBW]|nr:serine kinase protein [Rutstroemia sp. NJR-2017a BBW]
MASPPPTPSKLVPTKSEWRFCPVAAPTEWIEDYHPGKFLPVHFGDQFKDGRYRIIRKLGTILHLFLRSKKHYIFASANMYNRMKCYVALKVLTAQSTGSDTESSILEYLAQNTFPHPGKDHVIFLKDYFKHQGPNGEHGCLVFEAMGPSIATVVERLPKELLSKISPKHRYPNWMARSILQQALLGIEFLHQIGIAHGDVQPGNLLFVAKDLEFVEETRLSQKYVMPESMVPIKRQDGKIDRWAPRYLALNQPLMEFVELDYNFVIKISDMGGGVFDSLQVQIFNEFLLTNRPPKSLVTPVGLRSPETILKEVPTSSQDIWSFGCLVFELITGRPLFAVDNTGDENETNDDHFLQLHSTLGPIPRDILSKWTNSDVYFNSTGENIKSYIGELPNGFDVNELEHQPTLEELFDQVKPAEIDEEESKQIMYILRWILQYDADLHRRIF